MPGTVVTHSMDIEASADIVFDIVADPAQHPLIDGSKTVRRLLNAPTRLSLGSTFTMSMKLFGFPYWVTNRVVEFEEGQRIAWRHFEPQRWRYELEPLAGGTRVTESFDYSYYRLPGRWFIRLLRWPARNDRAISETLRRLKAAAEERAGSS